MAKAWTVCEQTEFRLGTAKALLPVIQKRVTGLSGTDKDLMQRLKEAQEPLRTVLASLELAYETLQQAGKE
jgi:hypothetical protein